MDTKIIVLLIIIFILGSSCQAQIILENEEPSLLISAEPDIIYTPTLRVSPTQTASQTLEPTITATKPILPTKTELLLISTITETPEVARPEGTVMEQASCRYGPGAAYLFEWGLYPGDYVRILNVNYDGTWVYVKPRSYNNECWVKLDLLETRGDINGLAEYYSPLPQGYLYKSTHYVIATRKGDDVFVQWEPVWMTEDDDRGYLIEAWVCQKGNYTFLPVGIFPYSKTYATITDEPGCSEESKALIYTVEKHGYIIPPVIIDWPNNP